LLSRARRNPLREIVVGSELFYTDDKASFIVLGSIVDMKTRENVSELRMRQLNRVAFDTLPLDQAIKIVRGNGKRKLAVFEGTPRRFAPAARAPVPRVPPRTSHTTLCRSRSSSHPPALAREGRRERPRRSTDAGGQYHLRLRVHARWGGQSDADGRDGPAGDGAASAR